MHLSRACWCPGCLVNWVASVAKMSTKVHPDLWAEPDASPEMQEDQVPTGPNRLEKTQHVLRYYILISYVAWKERQFTNWNKVQASFDASQFGMKPGAWQYLRIRQRSSRCTRLRRQLMSIINYTGQCFHPRCWRWSKVKADSHFQSVVLSEDPESLKVVLLAIHLSQDFSMENNGEYVS